VAFRSPLRPPIPRTRPAIYPSGRYPEIRGSARDQRIACHVGARHVPAPCCPRPPSALPALAHDERTSRIETARMRSVPLREPTDTVCRAPRSPYSNWLPKSGTVHRTNAVHGETR
jgi:hypothetical protein